MSYLKKAFGALKKPIAVSIISVSTALPAAEKAEAQEPRRGAMERAGRNPLARIPPSAPRGRAVTRGAREIIVSDHIPPHLRRIDIRHRGIFYDPFFPGYGFFRDPSFGLFFGYASGGYLHPRYFFDCDPRFDYLAARFLATMNVSRYGPTIGELRTGRWRLNAFDRWYPVGDDEPGISVVAGGRSPVNIGGSQTTTFNEGLSREEVTRIMNDAISDAERRGYERVLSEASLPQTEEDRLITMGYNYEICDPVQYMSEAVNALNQVFAEVDEDTGVNLHAYVGGSMQNPYILVRGPNDVLYLPKLDIISYFQGRKPGGPELRDYLDRNALKPMKIYLERDYPEIKFQFRNLSCRGF